MTLRQGSVTSWPLPRWVPDAAKNYLVHTESGLSIRAVARQMRCHPSTILRQVRKFEGRRDDPLVDAALASLSASAPLRDDDHERENETMTMEYAIANDDHPYAVTSPHIDQEAHRILRRLCEPGAVLAVAREMETAVVVRENDVGEQVRVATVEREVAQAMALRDWISSNAPEARIVRYFITGCGRSALRHLTAEEENRANGFAERPAEFLADANGSGTRTSVMDPQTARYTATESPLAGLARRKDKDGKPFLRRDQVAAGERLREDFELSQVGLPPVESWDDVMAGADLDNVVKGPEGAVAALNRVRDALVDLGPGLGDAVLRCCCFLEGLEQTEKKMGWSARSGKIVLRIALQRLIRHYEDTLGKYGPMIG